MNIIKPKIKFTNDYIFENNIYKNASFTKNPENKVIIEDIDFDSCIFKNGRISDDEFSGHKGDILG